MKKAGILLLALACVYAAVNCKKNAAAGKSVFKLFPAGPPAPPTAQSANCDGISNANPLPAYVSGKGWLPYKGQVFCNRMNDHWQKVRVRGMGKQDIKGCNYFLMPDYNAKVIDGNKYSNRYYPDQSHFQSWFAVYAVAPLNINGQVTRVPVQTTKTLVRRDNIAWAQFMGDPHWRKLVGRPGAMPLVKCARKEKGKCIVWRAEFSIPSHLDMGCCNWTAGPLPNTYKVYHKPGIGCYPNACEDSPTGNCGNPRANCPVACDACKSPIWRGTVENYQGKVRHTIISYQWYIGDWLLISIATGVVFTNKSGERVDTFAKFPNFKKDLEAMTRTITIYYDEKQPFTCSPSTNFKRASKK